MLKLAEAYGLQGIRAKDPGELRVEVPVGLMPQIETAMGTTDDSSRTVKSSPDLRLPS